MSADPQTVLSFYALPPGVVRRIEPLGSAGGWSGSRLWRISLADERQLCLRRHPPSRQAPDRLRFVHGVLARVHVGGLAVVPVPQPTASGETVFHHADHLWELTPWMPGAADFHAHPTRPRLRAALRALARFHLLAVTEGVPRVPFNLAPAVFERAGTLRKIAEHAAHIEASLRPGLGDELDARAARLLKPMRDVGLRLAPQLASFAGRHWFQQPVIRDIWHDHVLFTDDEVTGIVDFGAMNVDTPLTDVARLVGSLVGDDADARRFALDAYAELRPLTEDDRQLVDLLDAAGQVVAAVNWLKWLYVDRRDMGSPQPIIRRLDEILRRLEPGSPLPSWKRGEG